jgi:hypothetical protein
MHSGFSCLCELTDSLIWGTLGVVFNKLLDKLHLLLYLSSSIRGLYSPFHIRRSMGSSRGGNGLDSKLI